MWFTGFGKSILCPVLLNFMVLFRRKEGNVLFNDALNTVYLRLYVEALIFRFRFFPFPFQNLIN